MISDARRLLSADLLKLRRRRGLISLSYGLGAGLVAIMFVVFTIRHAASPAQYGPAGGARNFENASDLLGWVSLVVGAVIGSTAGAGDAEAGVLRDVVGTGRARISLFASRALAGCTMTLLVTLGGLALTTACAVALAGHLPAPSVGEVAHRGGAVLAFAAVGALLSAGVAELAGSRGPVIAAIILLGLVVSQFLVASSFLGQTRVLLPLAAFLRLVGDSTHGIGGSVAESAAVLAAWAAAALAIGAIRSRRAEV